MLGLEQAVVLCGGMGTRLKPYTDTLPKPMILCNGKPFIQYLLEQLSDLGVKRFVLLTGYMGEQIREFFQDGSKFGWSIEYSHGPVSWDTGKRVWEAKHLIDDNFILMYSDNFCPYPIRKLVELQIKNNSAVTLMVCPKLPGNIEIDLDGIITGYDNSRGGHMPFVEIGYMVVNKSKFYAGFSDSDISLTKVLKDLVSQSKVSGYIQKDRYQSISDPVRWKEAEKYLAPKKIILIDRDGVINQKALKGEYITNWKNFSWVLGSREFMKEMSNDGYKFIVITNQAGIARGFMTNENASEIHQRMTEELAMIGVEILDIYMCPHHWDEDCQCRKPKPGMLLEASRDFHFRLDKACFIGDDVRDVECAEAAGAIGILFDGNFSNDMKSIIKKFHA
jgi:histidinol-phosphate phosphatase family protein